MQFAATCALLEEMPMRLSLALRRPRCVRPIDFDRGMTKSQMGLRLAGTHSNGAVFRGK